jgi:hypothetical protein
VARVRRVQPAVKVRHFVMVNESLRTVFRERWREIDREWRTGLTLGMLEQPGFLDTIAICVEAARDELRAWVRYHAKDYPGMHLIPV